MNNICQICQEKHENLFRHLKKHKISAQEYVLKFEHNNIVPLCKCGCEELCSWNVGKKNYTLYIHGHNGNRKGAIISEETRKLQSESAKRFARENPEQVRAQQLLWAQASRTPEASAKRSSSMLEVWSDEQYKEKMSETHKVVQNNSETRKKRSIANKEWWSKEENREYMKNEIMTEKWREKISDSITQLYLDGGFQWSKGEYTSSKTGRTHYYRSSWELKHMQNLDADNSVITWDFEQFYILYEKEGRQRKYLPDFIVQFEDRTELHEIGVIQLKETLYKEKIGAAENFCKLHGWQFKLISY